MSNVLVAPYRSGVRKSEQSRSTLNALDYGHTVEAGVFAIQSRALGSSISTAMPLQIYVPAGTHTLSTPITITRHNVTLVVDGGARLIPTSNQAAIEDVVLDHLFFNDTKNSGSYNINLAEWSVFGLALRQIRAGFIPNRFLFVGAGNTNIVKYPEANYQSGAVTNNASTEYKSVTVA